MSKPKQPTPLTTAQVAKRLGVSKGTLRNWRSQGIGPKSFRQKRIVLGQHRYNVRDVERFEKRRAAGRS